MKHILISAMLFFTATTLFSQNLIGYTKSEIETHMKAEYKGFKLNTTSRNTAYKYLKYENGLKTETLLFFLSEDDVCTYCKYMGDYSVLNDKLREVNENWKKVDRTTWTQKKNGKNFRIVLEKGEWFFTLTTREIED
jgi:hypothetical protein